MVSRRLPALLAIWLVISSSLFVGSSVAGTEPDCNGVERKTIVEKDSDTYSHIEYTFQFSKEDNVYCVQVENKGKGKTISGFDATVDGRAAAPQMPTLESGETKYVVKNVSGHLDVKRDNHTVTLGVYNQTFVYNFTEELNATNPDVPAPTIKNVEVVRHEHNDSTSLKVAVHNPTKRGYGVYVQAKTYGTTRVDDIGAPQPNETTVFVLPLEESSDAVVAGKVRVFDNWGEPEGKYDQKEFLAEPDSEAEVWNDEFEHMPGTDSSAAYHNESTQQHRAGYVDDDYLSPLERKVGAVLAVVVLAAGVLWRRRRQFR